MGWLRELMSQAQPPIGSFGRLAKLAVAHSAWPKSVEVQPRSFAALLSRFDRDLELDWLNNRPECEQVLAQVLGCALADFRASSWPRREQDDAMRRIRFHDAPYARALDLLDEPLPPGLPTRLSQPSTWGRLWWHAPDGAGRSLAGRWLAARALAFNEPVDSQRGRTPAFVELSERADAPSLAPWARDGVCIAARYVDHAFVEANGFEVITSPMASEFAGDLVRWAAERFPADGNFDSDTAEQWLSELLPLSDPEACFGTLVGLCALFDELSARGVRGKSRVQLMEGFLKRRLIEAQERGSEDAAYLARHIADVFIPMMARALASGRAPLGAPRSYESWLELVPEEHRRGPDLDWMRATLTGKDRGLSSREVERAARRVPPGAFRIVRALQAANLLHEVSEGQWCLRPHWLLRVAEQEALAFLLRTSGFEWGEALLSPDTAGRVLARCFERVRIERAALRDSELDTLDSASATAAVEAETRCVGLAVALGDRFDEEWLAELWDDMRQSWISFPDGPPLPRVAFDATDDRAPLHDGWFHLAALALSEAVTAGSGARRAGPASELNPWSSAVELERTFDSIAAGLDAPYRNTELHVAALALVDRIRAAQRTGDSQVTLHRLQRPGFVVELASRGRLHWSSLAAVEHSDHPILLRLAAQSALGADAFSRAVIDAWLAAGAPGVGGTLLDPARARENGLWPRASTNALTLLLKREMRPLDDLLAQLDESQLGELWSEVHEFTPPARRALLRALPERRLRELLDAAGPMAANVATDVWALAPAATQRAVRRLLFEVPDAAVEWLIAAPDHLLPRALEPLGRMDRLDRLPSASLQHLRKYLHDVVRRKPKDVRLAYEALARLEREAFPRPH
ncbi:MAG: hypothetical protein R3B13_08885 [Polyangiaceae bacterium]